jgi:predicted NUDIX family NTP pyrophosphohydrolase
MTARPPARHAPARGRTPKTSAGILLYRRTGPDPEYFLVHLGGPFWAKKDLGAWSIPKGEIDAGEDPLAAARREFAEETGIALAGPALPLTARRQRSGKLVLAWTIEGDADAEAIRSNECQIEWPPRSGRLISIPEVDRAGWFGEAEALAKINPGQQGFITELAEQLRRGG